MSTNRLEHTIGVILRIGVVTSSVCLGAGLVCSWIGVAEASRLLLQVGVVTLLATPVARVVVSIVDYANERDWTFVLLTAIVLVELLASVVAALLLNRTV